MTLLELIAMAVVVGILTAIGVPTYRATIERQYCRQSQDLLLAVYTAERIRQTDTGSYFAPATDADWRILGVDNPNAPGLPVSFAIDIAGCAPVPCFTATATYQGDALLTINQDRTLASPSGRCPVS
jgi:Tfp pilus assembly protein PilE